MSKEIQLHPEWLKLIGSEFEKEYFQKIKGYLQEEKAQGHTVFPPGKLIFNALDSCPPEKVKVVIIGQDPYHNDGQAHGLCFSVPEGIKVPPSLVNIYKELATDIPGFQIPNHGNLQSWADQGVLLLNASLTVRAHAANSHSKIGWQEFTDAVIQAVNEHCDKVVFLLWGAYARSKAKFINRDKHLILEAPHPSPLSAHRGFLGCQHFSKANAFLRDCGKGGVKWSDS